MKERTESWFLSGSFFQTAEFPYLILSVSFVLVNANILPKLKLIPVERPLSSLNSSTLLKTL